MAQRKASRPPTWPCLGVGRWLVRQAGSHSSAGLDTLSLRLLKVARDRGLFAPTSGGTSVALLAGVNSTARATSSDRVTVSCAPSERRA